MSRKRALRSAGLIGLAALSVSGCALLPTSPVALSDRECITRAMYFESNRSSEDGMLAVGTTVMNRMAAPGFPKSVCGVVGQPGQYASGVLTKPMNPREAARVQRVADAVLSGERHPQVGGAMFFHTAGLSFPYSNMHYVAVAGGNAFYEKRTADRPSFGPTFDATAPAPRSVFAHRRPQTIDDLLISFADEEPVAEQIAAEHIPFPRPEPY